MPRAFDDNRTGFYTGLFLIALGSGGIKPLVVSFVGDQFDQSNKHIAKVVFDAFYWTINFGSFFASLLMPIFLRNYGPAVAFGIPGGILMFIATVIFWAGRRSYVNVPPAPADPHSFLRVALTALWARREGQGRPGLIIAAVGAALAIGAFAMIGSLGFVASACLALVFLLAFGGTGAYLQLDRASAVHPLARIEGVRAVLRILIVFALVTPFWSLFDQKASTWILQAGPDGEARVVLSSAQMQALNPALVMILIPFNNLVLYPALRRWGVEVTPLRKMGFGIAFSGSVDRGRRIQLAIDGGDRSRSTGRCCLIYY